MNTNMSKMYILIRDDVDLGHAILASAHASLSGYLTFIEQEKNEALAGSPTPELDEFSEHFHITPTQEWAIYSFRKVICKVTSYEFEKAKTYGKNLIDYRIMVESGLNEMEVAIVFKPRDNFEPFFKSLKLYK